MLFSNIPFKSEEKSRLIHQINANRIPHAQLFLGNEGSGNLALAMAYITYIFCENKQVDDSCGKCHNCNLTLKLIHPDVHFSYPVVAIEGKNRNQTTSDDFIKLWREALVNNPMLTIGDWQQQIDAQNSRPNINTKECNDIIQKLAYNAFSDGPKILIMWMPEYLGNEGNRLLKLIEEPTPNTYIILVANDQERILTTILSRCQLTKIAPYKEEEIKQHLTSQHNISEEFATQYARLSQGNIAKALELKSGSSDDNLSEMLFEWLRIAYKGDTIEMSSFADGIAGRGLDKIIEFLQYSLHFFEAYHAWLMSGEIAQHRMTQMEEGVASKMKNLIDLDKIKLISLELNNLIYYLYRNGNKKLNILGQTITIGDILKNRRKTSPNYRIFAEEPILIQ